MTRPDTPFGLMVEINAVLYGAPMLILLLATAFLLWTRPWRLSSAGQAAGKLALGAGIVTLAAVLSYGALLVGFGKVLEHPRYRAHFVCDPCF